MPSAPSTTGSITGEAPTVKHPAGGDASDVSASTSLRGGDGAFAASAPAHQLAAVAASGSVASLRATNDLGGFSDLAKFAATPLGQATPPPPPPPPPIAPHGAVLRAPSHSTPQAGECLPPTQNEIACPPGGAGTGFSGISFVDGANCRDESLNSATLLHDTSAPLPLARANGCNFVVAFRGATTAAATTTTASVATTTVYDDNGAALSHSPTHSAAPPSPPLVVPAPVPSEKQQKRPLPDVAAVAIAGGGENTSGDGRGFHLGSAPSNVIVSAPSGVLPSIVMVPPPLVALAPSGRRGSAAVLLCGGAGDGDRDIAPPRATGGVPGSTNALTTATAPSTMHDAVAPAENLSSTDPVMPVATGPREPPHHPQLAPSPSRPFELTSTQATSTSLDAVSAAASTGALGGHTMRSPHSSQSCSMYYYAGFPVPQPPLPEKNPRQQHVPEPSSSSPAAASADFASHHAALAVALFPVAVTARGGGSSQAAAASLSPSSFAAGAGDGGYSAEASLSPRSTFAADEHGAGLFALPRWMVRDVHAFRVAAIASDDDSGDDADSSNEATATLRAVNATAANGSSADATLGGNPGNGNGEAGGGAGGGIVNHAEEALVSALSAPLQFANAVADPTPTGTSGEATRLTRRKAELYKFDPSEAGSPSYSNALLAPSGNLSPTPGVRVLLKNGSTSGDECSSAAATLSDRLATTGLISDSVAAAVVKVPSSGTATTTVLLPSPAVAIGGDLRIPGSSGDAPFSVPASSAPASTAGAAPPTSWRAPNRGIGGSTEDSPPVDGAAPTSHLPRTRAGDNRARGAGMEAGVLATLMSIASPPTPTRLSDHIDAVTNATVTERTETTGIKAFQPLRGVVREGPVTSDTTRAAGITVSSSHGSAGPVSLAITTRSAAAAAANSTSAEHQKANSLTGTSFADGAAHASPPAAAASAPTGSPPPIAAEQTQTTIPLTRAAAPLHLMPQSFGGLDLSTVIVSGPTATVVSARDFSSSATSYHLLVPPASTAAAVVVGAADSQHPITAGPTTDGATLLSFLVSASSLLGGSRGGVGGGVDDVNDANDANVASPPHGVISSPPSRSADVAIQKGASHTADPAVRDVAAAGSILPEVMPSVSVNAAAATEAQPEGQQTVLHPQDLQPRFPSANRGCSTQTSDYDAALLSIPFKRHGTAALSPAMHDGATLRSGDTGRATAVPTPTSADEANGPKNGRRAAVVDAVVARLYPGGGGSRRVSRGPSPAPPVKEESCHASVAPRTPLRRPSPAARFESTPTSSAPAKSSGRTSPANSSNASAGGRTGFAASNTPTGIAAPPPRKPLLSTVTAALANARTAQRSASAAAVGSSGGATGSGRPRRSHSATPHRGDPSMAPDAEYEVHDVTGELIHVPSTTEVKDAALQLGAAVLAATRAAFAARVAASHARASPYPHRACRCHACVSSGATPTRAERLGLHSALPSPRNDSRLGAQSSFANGNTSAICGPLPFQQPLPVQATPPRQYHTAPSALMAAVDSPRSVSAVTPFFPPPAAVGSVGSFHLCGVVSAAAAAAAFGSSRAATPNRGGAPGGGVDHGTVARGPCVPDPMPFVLRPPLSPRSVSAPIANVTLVGTAKATTSPALRSGSAVSFASSVVGGLNNRAAASPSREEAFSLDQRNLQPPPDLRPLSSAHHAAARAGYATPPRSNIHHAQPENATFGSHATSVASTPRREVRYAPSAVAMGFAAQRTAAARLAHAAGAARAADRGGSGHCADASVATLPASTSSAAVPPNAPCQCCPFYSAHSCVADGGGAFSSGRMRDGGLGSKSQPPGPHNHYTAPLRGSARQLPTTSVDRVSTSRRSVPPPAALVATSTPRRSASAASIAARQLTGAAAAAAAAVGFRSATGGGPRSEAQRLLRPLGLARSQSAASVLSSLGPTRAAAHDAARNVERALSMSRSGTGRGSLAGLQATSAVTGWQAGRSGAAAARNGQALHVMVRAAPGCPDVVVRATSAAAYRRGEVPVPSAVETRAAQARRVDPCRWPLAGPVEATRLRPYAHGGSGPLAPDEGRHAGPPSAATVDSSHLSLCSSPHSNITDRSPVVTRSALRASISAGSGTALSAAPSVSRGGAGALRRLLPPPPRQLFYRDVTTRGGPAAPVVVAVSPPPEPPCSVSVIRAVPPPSSPLDASRRVASSYVGSSVRISPEELEMILQHRIAADAAASRAIDQAANVPATATSQAALSSSPPIAAARPATGASVGPPARCGSVCNPQEDFMRQLIEAQEHRQKEVHEDSVVISPRRPDPPTRAPQAVDSSGQPPGAGEAPFCRNSTLPPTAAS